MPPFVDGLRCALHCPSLQVGCWAGIGPIAKSEADSAMAAPTAAETVGIYVVVDSREYENTPATIRTAKNISLVIIQILGPGLVDRSFSSR